MNKPLEKARASDLLVVRAVHRVLRTLVRMSSVRRAMLVLPESFRSLASARSSSSFAYSPNSWRHHFRVWAVPDRR